MTSGSDAPRTPEGAGRAEAEAFEDRLRRIEASERDERLSRTAASPQARRPEYQAAVDVERLQARIEDLTAFRRAVQGSMVWRAAQTIRRLFGRAW